MNLPLPIRWVLYPAAFIAGVLLLGLSCLTNDWGLCRRGVDLIVLGSLFVQGLAASGSVRRSLLYMVLEPLTWLVSLYFGVAIYYYPKDLGAIEPFLYILGLFLLWCLLSFVQLRTILNQVMVTQASRLPWIAVNSALGTLLLVLLVWKPGWWRFGPRLGNELFNDMVGKAIVFLMYILLSGLALYGFQAAARAATARARVGADVG